MPLTREVIYREYKIHCGSLHRKPSVYNDRGLKQNSKQGVRLIWHTIMWCRQTAKITQLLDEDKVSNGVKGFNAVSINVAYIGGIDTNGKPATTRTDAQKAGLRSLLKMLT